MEGIYYNGREAVYRDDLPMPVPGPKESLIRVLMCAVCNTDKEVSRGYRPDFRGVMGHEFVGVVEESPEAALVGRRVVGELNAACGECLYCRTGRSHHCSNRRVLGMAGKDGCFAPYMTIDTSLLHVVPDDLETETAIFTEPLAAAFEILEQVPVTVSTNAAVLGDGRLSLCVSQVLALAGMEVTVIGRHPDKLRQFEPFARTATEGEKEGYELVVEATGSPSGIGQALDLVRKKGTIVVKSTYAAKAELDLSRIVVDEITLVGSRCGPFEPALAALRERKVSFPPVRIYELREFEEAFASTAFKAGFRFA